MLDQRKLRKNNATDFLLFFVKNIQIRIMSNTGENENIQTEMNIGLEIREINKEYNNDSRSSATPDVQNDLESNNEEFVQRGKTDIHDVNQREKDMMETKFGRGRRYIQSKFSNLISPMDEEKIAKVMDDKGREIERLRRREERIKYDNQRMQEELRIQEEVKRQEEKQNQIATYETKYRIQKRRYEILDKIRINCVNLTAYHNNRYHLYKNVLFTVFRVPLIILNGVNSFFSVGLQKYMKQDHVSIITAIISLVCGILTSIELLLNLQKRMELEQESGKEYYRLAVDIYTELSKEPDDRGENGDLGKFLNEKHNIYQTLYQKSNAINISERDFDDEFELYIIQANNIDAFYPDTGSVYKKNRTQFALHRGELHRPLTKPKVTENLATNDRKKWCDNITEWLMNVLCCICWNKNKQFDRSARDLEMSNIHFLQQHSKPAEASITPFIPYRMNDHEQNNTYTISESDEDLYHTSDTPIEIFSNDENANHPALMRSVSDRHRMATRQYAIRKKKKLTDVFKF